MNKMDKNFLPSKVLDGITYPFPHCLWMQLRTYAEIKVNPC